MRASLSHPDSEISKVQYISLSNQLGWGATVPVPQPQQNAAGAGPGAARRNPPEVQNQPRAHEPPPAGSRAAPATSYSQPTWRVPSILARFRRPCRFLVGPFSASLPGPTRAAPTSACCSGPGRTWEMPVFFFFFFPVKGGLRLRASGTATAFPPESDVQATNCWTPLVMAARSWKNFILYGGSI